MPNAASDVISALVPFAVARQCFAPSSRAYVSSNLSTCRPEPRYHLPLRRTSIHACSSVAVIFGHDGNGSVLTFAPPRIAGLPFAARALAPRAAVAAAEASTNERQVLRNSFYT